eukprot:TRINITY_DN13488_c0_g1_i2.p1 TRINITY_DN13488_c0_g1~~TRINITY_DN13488_c0_g1_i2.p1  ORF type:complete len:152 (+),score=28.29 TRINITY_DN13488_c0_g1_i2:61-456(+)
MAHQGKNYVDYNVKFSHRYSLAPVGDQLATRVAEKIKRVGTWVQANHRDYCGHGLVYSNGEFSLVEVSDGYPVADLFKWSTQSDFVQWLSRQSDWSLAGGDPNTPQTYRALDSFDFGNQTLSIDALRQFAR